ncbi:hypothetical protein [Streptomyces sp. B21-083]|uniref:hypothetical protein n=1 Tax=Streptomyces sp. B21-083 TaxID=3039410 RepID=UPI002FF0F3BC
MSQNLSSEPDADELEIRAFLATRGVGLHPAPPAPPAPSQSRRQVGASVMGYLILAFIVVTAAVNWRARTSDARFLARMAAVLAVVVAVQMWWGL